MRTTLSSLANRTECGPRTSAAVLLLILLAVGFCSALHAFAAPFWYDEICTVVLCHLPSASEIWKALDSAADTNPPVFYLITRWTHHFVSDDHLGYRLPSILGLLVTVFCIYITLRKTVRCLSALLGATFVLCTQLAAYGYEARPYALVLGCISGAALAWQRIDDSRLYSVVAACALATAVSLHYYAVLVWPAFLIAEASVWLFHRRFRIGAWLALLLGAFPLLLFAPLLLKLRQYYAENFWAKPSVRMAFLAHNEIFTFGGNWGVVFAAGITVVLLYFNIMALTGGNGSGSGERDASTLWVGEQALTLMLLWFPLFAVGAAKVAHLGMTERYMLPTTLGGALALGYLTDRMPSVGRVLVLILLLMSYMSSSTTVVKDLLKGSLLDSRAAATRETMTLVGQFNLPIVISSGIRYLPMAYYTPAESTAELFVLVDPAEAVKDIKTDSVDLALLVLRRYVPLRVEDYRGFVSNHQEFVLVVGGAFEWLPMRLLRDGYHLRLLSTSRTTIYIVTVK